MMLCNAIRFTSIIIYDMISLRHISTVQFPARQKIRQVSVSVSSSRQGPRGGTIPVPIVILPGFLTPSSSPVYVTMAKNLERYIHEESNGRAKAEIRTSYMGYGDWLRILGGDDFSGYLDRAYANVMDVYNGCGRREHVRLVGHSAGGWVGRLLLGDVPYQGTVYGAKTMVNTLVTLGTPHHSIEKYPFGRMDETIDISYIISNGLVDATDELLLKKLKTSSLQYCNHVYPHGDAFEPDTKIVCVAGDGVLGVQRPMTDISSYLTYQSYMSGCGRGCVLGDSVTPVEIALLPKASKTIVLHDVMHFGYGAYDTLVQWAHVLLPRIES